MVRKITRGHPSLFTRADKGMGWTGNGFVRPWNAMSASRTVCALAVGVVFAGTIGIATVTFMPIPFRRMGDDVEYDVWTVVADDELAGTERRCIHRDPPDALGVKKGKNQKRRPFMCRRLRDPAREQLAAHQGKRKTAANNNSDDAGCRPCCHLENHGRAS